MAGKNIFDPRNMVDLTAERRGILEELNLPPQAIAFIRKNSRNLQIAAACLVVAFLAWIYYGHHVSVQKDRSTALLGRAMALENQAEQKKMFDRLIEEYPRTDAAVWSRVELGHIAYKAGDYGAAAREYQAVLDTLDRKSPLTPLVLYSLAKSLESKGDFDPALAEYKALAGYDGFAGEAYLAMAGIYQHQGKAAKAREIYRKIVDQDLLTGAERAMVEEKLSRP